MAESPRRIRDPQRKQRILASAVELIARDGYNAVNLTDIGAAAGIVGSGIYRHFEGKAAILVELFDQVIDRLIANAEEALAGHVAAELTAAALVRSHVDLTLSERKLLRIYVQESRNLPESDQMRLRWKQRHYLDLWIDVVCSARPELRRAEGQLAVHACIGSIHSVLRYQSELGRAEQAQRLEGIAMGILDLPSPAVDAKTSEPDVG
jgi:AcrR family transcriptional regulator